MSKLHQQHYGSLKHRLPVENKIDHIPNLDNMVNKFKEYIKGNNGYDELDFKGEIIDSVNFIIELTGLEGLIEKAGKDLRSISWHSDGRVIAKSGAGAKNPRKLYSGKTPTEALDKLLLDNKDELAI